MATLAELIRELPSAMAFLDRDPRGYPVPWFVDRRAPLHNGGPDFRIMDGRRLKVAIREHRCWVCGRRIRGETGTFVAGPMCGINHVSAEPPNHLECARWSARACPFLSMPKRIRDVTGMPAAAVQAGIGIQRNPGISMLWTSRYTNFNAGHGGAGLLFQFEEPEAVEWWSKGREATRAEVSESVESGYPLLYAQAEMQGADAVEELQRMLREFIRWVPRQEFTHVG